MPEPLEQGEIEQRFTPNSAAQLRFFRSRAPRVLLSSGYGKGKSRVLCEKADAMCRAWRNIDVAVCRKTLASMWNTTIGGVFLPEVMEPSLRWNPSARGGPTVYYPNGSKIIFMGLEDIERAKSGQYAAALIDEADELTEEMVAAIAGRLRMKSAPWRQLAMVCNPRGRSHWLFKEFRPDRGNRAHHSEKPITLPSGERVPAGRLMRETIVSGPRDNVENLPLDYQIFLATLSGRTKQRFVDGLWVSFEGQVYDNWIDDLHVQRRPREWVEQWGGYPPPSWARYRSVDPGFTNPFCCQWWARDPAGRFWMYREIYKTRTLVSQHRRRIRKLERDELHTLREIAIERAATRRLDYWREKLRHLEMSASVIDPAAAEARAQLARSPFNIWTDHAETDVVQGIQTVYRLLAVDGEGLPRLIFVDDALDELDEELVDAKKPTCSADEFPNLHYPQSKEGKEVKEAPVKEDDHGCDAAKNLFHTLEVAGELGYAHVA